MRGRILFLLLWATLSAHAGTLELCQQQEQDKDGVRSCAQAQRTRSANQLRKASIAAQDAVRHKLQDGGSKSLLREYRSMQARHVRERQAHCRKEPGPIEQAACEADMNNAQTEQLARFID